MLQKIRIIHRVDIQLWYGCKHTDAWNINKVILILKLMLSWIYFNLPHSVFRLTCDSTSNLFQLRLLLLSNVLLISTCTLIHNVGKSVNVDEWYSNKKLSSTYICNWVPLLWSSKNSWVLICIHTCYGPVLMMDQLCATYPQPNPQDTNTSPKWNKSPLQKHWSAPPKMMVLDTAEYPTLPSKTTTKQTTGGANKTPNTITTMTPPSTLTARELQPQILANMK